MTPSRLQRATTFFSFTRVSGPDLTLSTTQAFTEVASQQRNAAFGVKMLLLAVQGNVEPPLQGFCAEVVVFRVH